MAASESVEARKSQPESIAQTSIAAGSTSESGSREMKIDVSAFSYSEALWESASTAESSGKQHLTIHDLGWSQAEAAALRRSFGNIADDWDAPEMDIYDEYS